MLNLLTIQEDDEMTLASKLERGQTGSASMSNALADAVTLKSFDVAGVPSAAANAGRLTHVSDGATGSPCLAYSNGTNWLRVLLGAAVATE